MRNRCGVVIFFLIASVCLAVLTGCQTPPTTGRSQAVARPAVPKRIPDSAWRTEAKKWLGTPYRYGGTDVRGFDCSGFSKHLYRQVAGIELPRTSQAQFKIGKPVSDRQLRAGDLVFFQTTEQPISHVGVWLGENQFVHASTSKGVIVSSLAEGYYSKRFRGARRVE